MNATSIVGFYDEMTKIALSLSADQIRRVSEKGAKRGWTAARESKSIKRLLSRDSRPEFYAANKARKAASEVPSTRVSRPPRKPPTSSSAEKPKAPPAPSFRGKLKRFAPKAAIGTGGIGAGAEAEHLHHKKREEREAA